MLETVGNTLGRDLKLAVLGQLSDWPQLVPELRPHFVLFVAADVRGVGDGELAAFAASALGAGAAYVCAWGPGCDRLTDVVDYVAISRNPAETEADVVMTTAHATDTLDEAVRFAVLTAQPAAAYRDTLHSVVTLVVGRAASVEHVRARLRES